MSSAVNGCVHSICKRLKKCLVKKVIRFGSPDWIPMILPLFFSSRVALQHETNEVLVVPKLHAGKICAKLHFNA